jgi:hypothetical protein
MRRALKVPATVPGDVRHDTLIQRRHTLHGMPWQSEYEHTLILNRVLAQQLLSWLPALCTLSCVLVNLQVKASLGPIDPYFTKLADAMVAWIDCWQKLNPNGEKGADSVPAST